MASNCTENKLVCAKCTGDHNSKECQSHQQKCIKCLEYHERNKSSNIDVNHVCGDEAKCFVYRNKVKYLQNKIDYGS